MSPGTFDAQLQVGPLSPTLPRWRVAGPDLPGYGRRGRPKLGEAPTILDIGCGRGLDGSLPLQRSLAELAGHYIGVEPDPEVPLADHFGETHRTLFEEAPIEANSVHLAFAVMVLEHLPSPQAFWEKLRTTLRQGGVFWAMTVDGRHPFARASRLADRMHIKSRYLNLIHGGRGVERYEDYPVYYRSNTPDKFVVTRSDSSPSTSSTSPGLASGAPICRIACAPGGSLGSPLGSAWAARDPADDPRERDRGKGTGASGA